MASETGHAKNVANFNLLVTTIQSFGAKYNPSNVALQIPALTVLKTNAGNAIDAVSKARTALVIAVNMREIAFEPVKILCTQLINSLIGCKPSKQIVEDMKTLNNKIQGIRKSKVQVSTGDEAVKPNSPMQLSFDSVTEHFGEMIDLLEKEPKYAPLEVPLQIVTLKSKLAELKAKNDGVNIARAEVFNKRAMRNTILYSDDVGLMDVASAIKSYVKGALRATSMEYKQVSKIRFKRG